MLIFLRTKLFSFIILFSLLLPSISFAEYALNTTTTINGSSSFIDANGNSVPVLRLSASLSGSLLTLTMSKIDGSAFTNAGTIYFKTGTGESFGANRLTTSINSGESTKSYKHNLNDYAYKVNIEGYPKDFYVRYEGNGQWIWAGPITVNLVSNKLSIPTGLEPTKDVDASEQLTFKWNPVSRSNTYRIVLAQDSILNGFTNNNADSKCDLTRCETRKISCATNAVCSSSETEYSGFNLLPSKHYCYSVRAGVLDDSTIPLEEASEWVSACFNTKPVATPQSILGVGKAGSGTGLVTSSPSGINCGTTCQSNYNVNNTVTLIPTPDSNSEFAGWNGACNGMNTCQIPITSSQSIAVTATFNKKIVQPPVNNSSILNVSVGGSGTGTVNTSPSGINCSASCQAEFTANTVVNLTATAGNNSKFVGWSGACSGIATCQITIAAAQSIGVSAIFDTIVTPPSSTNPTYQEINDEINDTDACWRNADPHNKYIIFQSVDNPVSVAEIKDGNASHNLSPAEIIYYSAKENTLNPVLLLAKLQQEQSLLTQGKNWSNDAGNFEDRLYKAMGVGTYDSGGVTTWYGFYPQVVSSAYEWYLSRERDKKPLEDALKEYTTNPDAYQQLLEFYADYAEKMNDIAGASFETYPNSSLTGGYYNDFRNITADNIQTFLELSAFSNGALSNKNLFRELPIEGNTVNYCDNNTINDETLIVQEQETPSTLICQNNGLILPVIDDNPDDNIVWKQTGNPFGNYLIKFKGFHPGDDWNLRTTDDKWANDLGQPVYSIADGTIVKVIELSNARGYLVVIKHEGRFTIPAEKGNGYEYGEQQVNALYSSYVHINTLQVSVGDAVKQAQHIANIMNPGGGSHLHFEIALSTKGLSDWYPLDRGNGYYTATQSIITDGFRNPLSVIEANECEPVIVKTNDKAKGDVSILSNLISSSDSYTVKLDSQTVSITSIADGNLRFNTGLAPSDYAVTKPLSVIDAQGNTIIETYYPFSDVKPDQWYTNAIIQLWKANIIDGYDNGTFKVGKSIKRAELLKLALLALGHASLAPINTSFTDVDSTHWGSGYINYALSKTIISNNPTFRPDDPVTRAETAKIFTKTFSLANNFFSLLKVWETTPDVCGGKIFTDLKSGAWYCEFIEQVYKHKLMKGSGSTFKPQDELSREEAAMVACRAYFYQQPFGNLQSCEQ